MRPVSPTPSSTKEKADKLVSLYNQVDRNSRMSSFKEGGTDVGRQSNKTRLNNGPDKNLGRPRYSAQDVGRPPNRPTDNREANRDRA